MARRMVFEVEPVSEAFGLVERFQSGGAVAGFYLEFRFVFHISRASALRGRNLRQNPQHRVVDGHSLRISAVS